MSSKTGTTLTLSGVLAFGALGGSSFAIKHDASVEFDRINHRIEVIEEKIDDLSDQMDLFIKQ